MSTADNLNIELNVIHKNQFPTHDDPKVYMNVLSLNIQSLRNKLNDFTDYVENSKIIYHVIVLTETHIQESEMSLFNLPGYKAEHCVRKSGRFGGVSIFVRKDFTSFNLIHKLDFDMNNSLLINLEKFDIKIAAMYRCRDFNLATFLNRLDFLLDNYNNCYIFGDFNLDLFKTSSDATIKNYSELVQSNGYIFLNSLSMPTRVDVNRNTATCIDHIITDAMFHNENISYVLSLDDLFGDHKALLLNVFQPKYIRHNKKKYYEVVKIDHAKIISHNLLSHARLSSFHQFQKDLKSIFDTNTVRYTKRDRFEKPFMTIEVLNFITIKHNYFKLLRKYPSNIYVNEQFRIYRNLVSKKVTALKKDFYQKKFSECFGNSKETWRNINNLLRNTDSKPVETCTTIKKNNHNITNKHQIVENFNAFFVTAVDSIHNSIIIDEQIFSTLHNFETYSVHFSFECLETTPVEICSIISNLSNSDAKDVNGFSNKLFKKYRTALSKPLSLLINKCIRNSEFPECLKIAKVKPLFKSGDKTDMNNYRPIAISP